MRRSILVLAMFLVPIWCQAFDQFSFFETQRLAGKTLKVNKLKYHVIQINIGSYPKGTFIRICGGVQVTNNLGFNVGWTTYVRYDRIPGRGTDGKGHNLGGQNITPGRHHDTRTFCYSHVVNGKTADSKYAKIVLKSYSTRAKRGDRLSIDKGWLQVEVWE